MFLCPSAPDKNISALLKIESAPDIKNFWTRLFVSSAFTFHISEFVQYLPCICAMLSLMYSAIH